MRRIGVFAFAAIALILIAVFVAATVESHLAKVCG